MRGKGQGRLIKTGSPLGWPLEAGMKGSLITQSNAFYLRFSLVL